jgi:hypothetical protein
VTMSGARRAVNLDLPLEVANKIAKARAVTTPCPEVSQALDFTTRALADVFDSITIGFDRARFYIDAGMRRH